jgi:hypothetical protein
MARVTQRRGWGLWARDAWGSERGDAGEGPEVGPLTGAWAGAGAGEGTGNGVGADENEGMPWVWG